MWRTALAALLLLAACKRPEPACFKIQTVQGIDDLGSGVHELSILEAFVMSDPPDEPQALLAAVARTCGSLPEPQVPASSVHWMVYKETYWTPRTFVPGLGKRDTLDHHQDDEILEIETSRGSACGDSTSWTFLHEDALPTFQWERLPRAADAGPPPPWCGK